MRRALVGTLAGLTVVVLGTFAGVIALLFLSSGGGGSSGTGRSSEGTTPQCSSPVTGLGNVRDLDADQLANAKIIIEVGRSLQIPERGIVVAIATAMQESSLHNIPYGDRDSVGLFQQRPSSGWGTVAELTTPTISAKKFYAALLTVPGWESMPVTVAAQRVQRSAFPLAYAKWEGLATAVVSAAGVGSPRLDCTSSIGFSIPTGAAGDMLRIALGQQGKPYVWGATGPDSFDCSGLVVYSWRMAGYRLSVRTSEQMYAVSDRVPMGSEQPGDLLFGEFRSAGPGHVMIVVRPGLAVEAPQTGDVVKLISFSARGGWVVGRLHADTLTPLRAG
ncbi:MAG TPA: NlpC/P60 family protein [Kineosporiaceae bacterium]